MKKVGLAVVVLGGLVFGMVGSASAQTAPTLSIEPSSGPIGTVITATVANCQAGNADGTARLDFSFEGLTPSSSVSFTPAADGSATVTIEALDKAPQSDGLTAAKVVLSQCAGGGFADVPFTVTDSAPPATTGPGPARPIDSACPADVPDAGFSDVPDGNVHAAAIGCASFYEITTGTSDTTYGPSESVPRDQMASFIARLIDYVDPDVLGPVPTTDQFPCASDPDELPADGAHHDAVQRLAAKGLVEGGPGGRPADCYGPDLDVTRAQMASFIHRAEIFLGYGITNTENFFSDDEGDTHEANIDAVAAEQIAVGYGGGLYGPGQDIGRDQMASFLARKLDYLVDAGATEPPPIAWAD